MVVVVLPTPPFWLAIAMMRAGPWISSGAGLGISRRVVYAVGSAGPRSAPRSRDACSALRPVVQESPRSSLLAISGFALPPTGRLYDTGRVTTWLALGVSRRVVRRVVPSGRGQPAASAAGSAGCERAGVGGDVHLAQVRHGDQ